MGVHICHTARIGPFINTAQMRNMRGDSKRKRKTKTRKGLGIGDIRFAGGYLRTLKATAGLPRAGLDG